MQKPIAAPSLAALLILLSGALSPVFAQKPQAQQPYAQQQHRTYKASAYVTVLSIPVFSRSDVGYASAEEHQWTANEGNTVELDFLSGSIPERAHGLNRFGYIHETVQEQGHSPVSADYQGLLTLGGDQSVHHGQAFFDVKKSAEMPYLAASEHIAHHQAHASLYRFLLPAPRESAVEEIVRMAKEDLERPQSNALQEERNLRAGTAQTFLYSLRSAIQSQSPAYQQQFIYVGKLYTLETEKHSDDSLNAEFLSRRLIHASSRVNRLSGVVTNLKTRERSDFTLWVEEGSATCLPLRFEFRPKPYLKLVFDAQPEGSELDSRPELLPAPLRTPHDKCP